MDRGQIVQQRGKGDGLRGDYYLRPGFLFVTQDPVMITTILGSCISVCLHDMRRRFGGMNHYLLPEPAAGDDPTTKFGTVSIRTLVRSMEELGADRKHLQSWIIGGASLSENSQSRLVADLNIEIAYLELARFGIPVITAWTGGSRGRKVFFLTDTGTLEYHYVDDIVPEIPGTPILLNGYGDEKD